MTHDCTHCADYDSAQCPESCYFGQLEKDLQKRQAELCWLPISYAHIWREGMCPYSGSAFREKQIDKGQKQKNRMNNNGDKSENN